MHRQQERGALTAPVNKIIPFSVVDGPGSRSAVFFQGCDFHCAYCHNPETIGLCAHCGACVSVCPAGALENREGKIAWDPAKCCGCDACIHVCPHSSSPRIRQMTTDEVLAELKTALPFIRGITVSGGECTLQEAFITELFEKVKALGKTAFADTNGQKDFRQMEALTAVMDKAMLDVKAWDEETHIRLTGSSNRLVRANLEYLGSIGKLYEVRTVIVPDFLPNEQTVEEVSRRIARFSGVRYKLIKFRTFGVRGELKEHASPDDAYMQNLEKMARDLGVQDIVVT